MKQLAYKKVTEEKQDQVNPILGIIIFILVIGAGFYLWDKLTNKPESFVSEDYSSFTTAKSDDWELTLYSSSNPNYLYETDRIEGLANKEACLSEGYKRVQSVGSFECSYRCKTQYTEFQGSKDEFVICEKVCDENGDCRE